MKFLVFCLIILSFLSCEERSSSESTYRIAYNVLYDPGMDDYEIFTMNLDGSDKKNISQSRGVDWVYYAYKDKLYFLSDRDSSYRSYFLYEMDWDGENVRQITSFNLRDSWMGSRKDGEEFVVAPARAMDSTSFFIIDRQGEILSKVRIDLPYFSDPIFSPDGKQIVFRGGTARSKRDTGFVDELYRIEIDGTNLTKLTNYPLSDTTAEWFAYKAGTPHWNPHENFISYQSKQEGRYQLFAVSPDASRQWKLLEREEEQGWHNWSPDGKMLAIEIFDKEQTQFHIALIQWEEQDFNILTDSTFVYQQAPVFVEAAK